MNKLDYSESKSFRLLNMYERLQKGEKLKKEELSSEFSVSLKSIQRDIDDLRAYLTENHNFENGISIQYNKADNTYSLSGTGNNYLTNKEALAICKIILESRAFRKDEVTRLIEKIILQVSVNDKAVVEELLKNELFNYVPLRHNKELFTPLWNISSHIIKHEVIQFDYVRQDGKVTHKEMKPVSILFSEFYFYCIAFDMAGNTDYPIIFRMDRMSNIKATGEKFDIPYKDRFQDGDFRQRIQFMYSGKLRKVTFEYSGILEAMLDKVPTAKVICEENGKYTITAETYGNGIFMWLGAQGEKATIIEDKIL